jgi:hypothetical protein
MPQDLRYLLPRLRWRSPVRLRFWGCRVWSPAQLLHLYMGLNKREGWRGRSYRRFGGRSAREIASPGGWVRKKADGLGWSKTTMPWHFVVVVWPPAGAPTRSYPSASGDEEKIRPLSTWETVVVVRPMYNGFTPIWRSPAQKMVLVSMDKWQQTMARNDSPVRWQRPSNVPVIYENKAGQPGEGTILAW